MYARARDKILLHFFDFVNKFKIYMQHGSCKLSRNLIDFKLVKCDLKGWWYIINNKLNWII